MSSFSGAIERWSIADLRQPVNPDDYTPRISPAKSIATAVDSAYSSFSGSSYVADYQTSFQSDNYHLTDDQRSYMDSGYVKAVYNPSIVDNRAFSNDTFPDGRAYNSETSSRTGNISSFKSKSHGSPDECLSSQKQLDCSVTIREIDNLPVNGSSDNCLSPSHDVSHFSSEHKVSRHHRRSPNWVKDVPGSKERIQPPNLDRMVNHSFTRLSDNVPMVEESYLPNVLSTNLSEEINCTYDHKQFPCINKLDEDYFKQIDLELEERYSSNIHSNVGYTKQSEFHSGSDRSSKIMTRHSNEMSERLGVYDHKSGSWISMSIKENYSYDSKRTISDELMEISNIQSHTSQKKLLSQNIMDTDGDDHGRSDLRYKCLEAKNGQVSYQMPFENVNVLSLKTINPENAINEETKIHKDATIKTIPMLSPQLENAKPENNFCDLSSGKITKEATPMLYHLSGGCSNSFTSNPVKQTEQNHEPKAFKKLEPISTVEFTEFQINVKPLRKNRSQSHLVDLPNDPSNDDCTTGSLTSSTEESFMHDYREKLKVAQKKVLRETSFKRKDLQMSLPGRLKINPSKRPSIDHLRSYSLSSANNETKFVQPKTLVDANPKKTDTEKSNVSRIGGRKRITKEQRKLCYSEPEKLDHLGVQSSGFAWKEESPLLTQMKSSNPDMTALNVRCLDGKERTLSTTNVSKVELKQIQQNALMQYMERKTNQRLSSSSQSTLQSTSGMKRYERKSMPNQNERPSPTYLHRRSTGASSSYDATVTWGDRFSKNSQSVEEKCRTYLDQHTTEDKNYNEDYPLSACQKSKLLHAGQVSSGYRTSSTSALFNAQEFSSRLSVSEDNVFSESDRGSAARERGKSMDEIGTADIVRRSVMSQSSDQLYHIKEPLNLPGTESASNTSAVHQERLWVSTENALGNVPNQTSIEDFVRPPRSDVASSAWDRHSRPSRASAVSSTTETSISQEIPFSGALEKSTTLFPEDEVFSQAIAIRKELSSRASLVHQEDCRRPLTNRSPTPSSITVSDHLPLQNQMVTAPSSSSDILAKDLPENSNEVRDDTSDLLETQAVKRLSDPTEDREETKSEEPTSMSNSQQGELILLPPSQVNALQTSPSPVGQNEHKEYNDTDRVEPDACELKSSDPGGDETFPRVDVKQLEDDRHAELVKEIIAEDRSLADILKPLPVRESAMELMKSLFLLDMSEMERCRCRGHLKKDSNEISLSNKEPGLESASKLSSKTMLLLQKTSLPSAGEPHDGVTAKKQSLKERHNLLSRQREDAKDLKENLDRRERVVTGILSKYLRENQIQDHKHFVKLKTSFLIEQKNLDEKIKFHEEQLESLHNSIPP
uniref:Uncharacterized protein n=1 Tax=Leptobrachium leishanense TaxID=445787 RepID=A0A8C5QJX1_9ANUR